MVTLTPIKFDGDRHRGIADLMILDCHVISQDHVTKRLSNTVGGAIQG